MVPYSTPRNDDSRSSADYSAAHGNANLRLLKTVTSGYRQSERSVGIPTSSRVDRRGRDILKRCRYAVWIIVRDILPKATAAVMREQMIFGLGVLYGVSGPHIISGLNPLY